MQTYCQNLCGEAEGILANGIGDRIVTPGWVDPQILFMAVRAIMSLPSSALVCHFRTSWPESPTCRIISASIIYSVSSRSIRASHDGFGHAFKRLYGITRKAIGRGRNLNHYDSNYVIAQK